MDPRPNTGQRFATSEKDITKAQIGELLVPEDSVLAKQGGTYKIYDSLLTDDQVKSTLQQRRGAVTSRPTEVEPASESGPDKAAADFIREQIDALAWDDITDKHLFGTFYGYSVAECLYANDGRLIVLEDIKVRNRRRFRYGKGGELRLITQSNYAGDIMDDRYFWHFRTGATHSDEPYGLGLAHFLYWPVFLKRNDMKFWLAFLEKFGTPQVIGKLPRSQFLDASYQTKVLDALEKLRQDAVGVVPDDLVVEVLEATKGTADYSEFDKRMDYRIAKIVLSQTLTTEAVGGQYKGEVHKDVRDEVIQADARVIDESFNDQVVKRLVAWNFPNAVPPKVRRQTEPDENVNERAERDTKVYALGFEPTEEYIVQHYGEGWVKRQSQIPPSFIRSEPGDEDDDEESPEFAELRDYIDRERRARRNDQESMKRAAVKFAEHSPDVVGDRVRQLLQELDESEDLVAFREKLADLVAQAPPEQTVEAVRRGGILARILGTFRGQRDTTETGT